MLFHHCTRLFFTLIATLAFVSACEKSSSTPETTIGVNAAQETLVTTGWLNEHLADPDLVVLDCSVRIEFDENGGFRSLSGRTDYEAGHIPSAGFADLTSDLSNLESPFQFALPTPEQFASVMGALGVGDNTRVVLYDNSNSAWAARVWWMLRWVGFDRVALLDGGLAAWTADGHALSSEPANHPVQQLTLNLRPELIANQDEVHAAIDNDAVHLIDALPESHFRGDMIFYDRTGHIPGAANIPSSSLMDESGRYRPNEELAAILEGDRKARNITYCGGGIAASSNAFVMTRLGFTDVAVYISSLQEWANNTDNPMVTDTP